MGSSESARQEVTKLYKVQIQDKIIKRSYLLGPDVAIKLGVLELRGQIFFLNGSPFVSTEFPPVFCP